jgi:hypothetical protein
MSRYTWQSADAVLLVELDVLARAAIALGAPPMSFRGSDATGGAKGCRRYGVMPAR